MMRLAAASLIAIVIVALAAGSAAAEPASRLPAAEAEWLARGNRHLARRQYTQALAAYEAGYALAKRSVFLFNIGQAKRLAGDCPGAVAAYRQFIETEPDP